MLYPITLNRVPRIHVLSLSEKKARMAVTIKKSLSSTLYNFTCSTGQSGAVADKSKVLNRIVGAAAGG
jgi:hypothetical protein